MRMPPSAWYPCATFSAIEQPMKPIERSGPPVAPPVRSPSVPVTVAPPVPAAVAVQVPAVQAWPAAHTTPQPPQWLALVCVSTQAPLHGTLAPCSAGRARPAEHGARVPCNGACVDTQTNASHCGGCGVVCAAGQACTAGTCTATAAGTGGATVTGTDGERTGGATGGPERSMGFIGCSMAENVAQGYQALGGMRMWPPYGTGGLVVQSWTSTNTSSWRLFVQQVATDGEPSAVLGADLPILIPGRLVRRSKTADCQRARARRGGRNDLHDWSAALRVRMDVRSGRSGRSAAD